MRDVQVFGKMTSTGGDKIASSSPGASIPRPSCPPTPTTTTTTAMEVASAQSPCTRAALRNKCGAVAAARHFGHR